MNQIPIILATITSPLRLEYLSVPSTAALFACIAWPVIWLGATSLNWLGATRKWVSISLRLSVIWVLVLLLAGAQWTRRSDNLDVIFVRDISTSTGNVKPPTGTSLSGAVDGLVRSASQFERSD